MDLLHTAHIPPGDGPLPTVLALHGWGASAHDLLGLAPLFPGVLFLCPQGKIELEIGPGAKGYGWFPLVPDQPPEPRAFLKASSDLRTFVSEAIERYPVDRRRFVVLGFSQGGVMGYELALRAPERFRGLIALSSWLPDLLAANLPRTGEHRDFPVLVIHGTEDPLIEVDRARESRRALDRFEVDLTYREFTMGHEIRPDALRLIADWLRDNVSPPP